MSELRDLYDINSNKTDKTYRKGEEIPKGYYPNGCYGCYKKFKRRVSYAKEIPK